jgi:hypothetical protein
MLLGTCLSSGVFSDDKMNTLTGTQNAKEENFLSGKEYYDHQ